MSVPVRKILEQRTVGHFYQSTLINLLYLFNSSCVSIWLIMVVHIAIDFYPEISAYT
jgi:hypothetical protein